MDIQYIFAIYGIHSECLCDLLEAQIMFDTCRCYRHAFDIIMMCACIFVLNVKMPF